MTGPKGRRMVAGGVSHRKKSPNKFSPDGAAERLATGKKFPSPRWGLRFWAVDRGLTPTANFFRPFRAGADRMVSLVESMLDLHRQPWKNGRPRYPKAQAAVQDYQEAVGIFERAVRPGLLGERVR